MRVQDLMSHPAITCHVDDDLDIPAKLMWEHDCGAIPVVRDDDELAGKIAHTLAAICQPRVQNRRAA